MTGALLFTYPVRSGIVLWLLRVLLGFLRWTVVVGFRLATDVWWTCDMTSRTARSATDGTGEDAAVGGLVPSELSDLDSSIPDAIDLRTWRPEAAVVKVMLIPNNHCVRVIIPDENVGPYAALAALASLRLDWRRQYCRT